MEIIETNLQFNSNKTIRDLSSIKRIILHHSGVTVLQTVETIHNYHKNTRGYAGIGYHFYVRKDGKIYRGRPLEWVGAHAYNNNADSIGICAEGDFNSETISDIQKNAIIELVTYLKGIYNISNVKGHKEVCNTSCPGTNFPLGEIVNTIVAKNETVAVVDEKKERIKELQSLLNKVYNSGLAVDGIIGQKTNAALRKVALKNYCANELVTFVQRRLIMNGRGVGNCGADGKYGKDTANAVCKFQQANGLAVDGIAGINTIKALI